MSKTAVVRVAVAGLIGAIVCLDLVTPLGMGVWPLFGIPLALAARALPRRDVRLLAALLPIFVGLPAFFSPPGLEPELALISRTLGVLALWVFVQLLASLHASREALEAARAQLEAAVRERTAELEVANARLRGEEVERREATAALAASNRFLRQVLDAVPEPLMIADAEHRITLINEQLRRVLGYSDEELVGRGVDMLVPGRLRAAHERSRAGYAQHPAVRPMGGRQELYASRRDGTEMPCEISLSPIETSGGVHVIAVLRDITERRKLEAQLLQSQKIEAVGRLAGGVAHDFNNLLTVILSSADLLEAVVGGEGVGREELTDIQQAGQRAAELTRQLLAFSRRQTLAPRVIDLNDALSQTQGMLRRLIGENIEVRLALQPEIGPVRVDPGQLEQVIVNLVVNARDAMPDGGTITLETADVELSADYAHAHAPVQPGPYVMLAVNDTGTGMSIETLSHLFEPFFTTKDKGKGTGLGLAMVYGIIKQSGGYIWAYSEPGLGSTFKIYFPRVEGVVERVVRNSGGGTTPGGSEIILLVEDEDLVRRLAYRILDSLGYRVLVAASGPEALALAEAHPTPIDLLVTDVVMPGMMGKELATRLTEARPATKVLFMSGYASDAIIRRGALEPEVQFLQKPFTPDLLGRKVREALGRAQLAGGT